MKNLILPILVVLSFVTTAVAEIVIANNVVNYGIGYQSDAFSSNGSYNSGYGSSGAQSFGTEDAFTLSSLEWWGSAYNDYSGPLPGLSNVAGFQIVVWDATFTTKVIEKNVALADLAVTDTGVETFYGEQMYHFRTSFAFDLDAGSYFMNIGAYLHNPNGSHWIWAEGVDSYAGFWVTTANSPAFPWGDWRLPQWLGAPPGGAFVLNAPSPGTVALLGLAGLLGTRRRKE
jgi:MYXO-CTERM domain-containing protein